MCTQYLTKFSYIYHFSWKCAGKLVIIKIQVSFEMRKSQDLQVMGYFGQLSLSMLILYIHNKDIQIIIHNYKSIKYLILCVHNNLQS